MTCSMWDKGKHKRDKMHNHVMNMCSLDTHSVRETDVGTRHERECTGSIQEGTQGESTWAHADAMEMTGVSQGYHITCGSSCEGLGLSTRSVVYAKPI